MWGRPEMALREWGRRGGDLSATLTLPTAWLLMRPRPTWFNASVGSGIEFGFAPNWSAGIEYNHLFMQDRTHTFVDGAGAFFAANRIEQDVDLVTVRINYRFGGYGAPVAARYWPRPITSSPIK
jgi:hypothetical protein